MNFQSPCIPECHQTKWHRGCHRNLGPAKPVCFPLHSQGTTGDPNGLRPTPAQGSEPTASSSTSQHAPGLPQHNASASLSSRSWAPAPWITQAPMSHGNGHERKCLNRFSLLEHTALPAVAALGLGTRALLAGAPRYQRQQLWAVQRQPMCPPCLQPALLPSSLPQNHEHPRSSLPRATALPKPLYRPPPGTRLGTNPKQTFPKVTTSGKPEGEGPLEPSC